MGLKVGQSTKHALTRSVVSAGVFCWRGHCRQHAVAVLTDRERIPHRPSLVSVPSLVGLTENEDKQETKRDEKQRQGCDADGQHLRVSDMSSFHLVWTSGRKTGRRWHRDRLIFERRRAFSAKRTTTLDAELAISAGVWRWRHVSFAVFYRIHTIQKFSLSIIIIVLLPTISLQFLSC